MKAITAKPLLVLFLTVSVITSVSANSALFDEIKQQDKIFFGAFNSCNIEVMAEMFSKDLEFYHDIAGLGDYEKNMQASRNLCDRKLGLVRTLIPESLEVYPVKDFGAMQIGKHTFCHPTPTSENKDKQDCGTFGFTHIWKQTEDGWKIHRVMSYGH